MVDDCSNIGSSSPGRPGCRNVKGGGDNVIPSSDGWYATYVVYRSFRYPPAIPKMDALGGAGAWPFILWDQFI